MGFDAAIKMEPGECAHIKAEALKVCKEDVAKTMRKISDTLHGFAETAFKEHRSAALLCDTLEASGFTVERGYCDMPTSFRAEINRDCPGPAICLLAEYDALPALGHACGHNLISAATVGAALSLRSLAHHLPGKIVVIGSPAEESGGGKAFLVERGAFHDIDAALIAHPATKTYVASRALAWEPLRITFRGRPSHAGSAAHEGVNALNAVIETFNSINALRQHVTSDVRIHGIITHGGDAVNIVPEVAQADFLIRAATLDHLSEMVEKVKDCARGAATATGTSVALEKTGPVYKPIRGNRPLERAFAQNLELLGVPHVIGGDKINMGSTDMGNVSFAIPALHPQYSIAERDIVAHTSEFAEVTASDYANERTLEMAVALAFTCIDLFLKPDLLEAVKEAFGRS